VGHLLENDFEVTVVEVADIAAFQAQRGIAPEFRGCHSSQIGDYTIEGHVPADLIMRFLEEDSGLAGITVPGMVMGPPGMEGPEPVPYNVWTFERNGRYELYESR